MKTKPAQMSVPELCKAYRSAVALSETESNHMVATCAKTRAAALKRELEVRFLSAGRAGANADTKHPLRVDWELAREIATL